MAAAAAAAGSARRRAGPVSAAERRARRAGPGAAQAARRGGGGGGSRRPAGAACGLASQVRTGALRGGGRRGAAGGDPRRGPRNLHCVMGPVRQHLRHRRGAGAGRPGRRGLGPAGPPASARGAACALPGRPAPLVSEWPGRSRLPGRWRRRPPAWAGRRGWGAGGGRGRRGGAGGRGRAGGGPRRPALPAAAILSSEEEEEEEEAAAAESAARPAPVSPGPAWWPRAPLSPTAVSGAPSAPALTWAGLSVLSSAPGSSCPGWGSAPPPPFPRFPGRPRSSAENGAGP